MFDTKFGYDPIMEEAHESTIKKQTLKYSNMAKEKVLIILEEKDE